MENLAFEYPDMIKDRLGLLDSLEEYITDLANKYGIGSQEFLPVDMPRKDVETYLSAVLTYNLLSKELDEYEMGCHINPVTTH